MEGDAEDWDERFHSWWDAWFWDRVIRARDAHQPLRLHRDLQWMFFADYAIQRLLTFEGDALTIIGVPIEWVDDPPATC